MISGYQKEAYEPLFFAAASSEQFHSRAMDKRSANAPFGSQKPRNMEGGPIGRLF